MADLTSRIEYDAPDGKRWKVEQADQLQMDIGPSPDQLTRFHEIVCRFDRGWKVVRMLYGISPLVYTVKSDADYMQSSPKWQVAQKLNMTTGAINRTVKEMYAVWAKSNEPEDAVQEVDVPPIPVEPKAKKVTPVVELVPVEEPEFGVAPSRRRKKVDEAPTWIAIAIDLPPLKSPEDQELLDTYGFPASTFGREGRDPVEAIAERAWFVTRLKDMQKLFDEPKMISSLARMALINEMQLRRLDGKMCMVDADHPNFSFLQETKQSIEQQLENQWSKIKEVCPWAVNVENKISFSGVISDLTLSYRDFIGKNDNRRIDGLMTNFEIQCQMRAAVQHDTRYRAGQAVAIMEAIQNIWNPNYQRSLSDKACKLMDAGWREGVRLLREEMGMDLPDLEKDGPAGEYPPLYQNKEEQNEGPAEQPNLNVAIDLKT